MLTYLTTNVPNVVEMITELINNNLFPIACVVYLFFREREKDKETNDTLNTLSESVKNNTIAMTQLRIFLEENQNGKEN